MRTGLTVRICIVMEYHPHDHIGGSEVQVFGLAREFARAGHEVTYVCQRPDRARALDETIDGVRVLRTLPWRRVFRFLVGPGLLRTVRTVSPEIIYQRFASPLTGSTAIVARLLAVPFVWGCSQDESLERGFLTRGQTKTSGGLVRRLKALLLRANALVNQRLFYFGVRRAQAVVVQNDLQLELLARSFGRAGQVIPNGIALSPVRAETPAEPLVLWLNRITRGKNAEAFIELARSMHAERPDVRFVLVGGRQNDAYAEEIRRRAAEVPNLELTGSVPLSEVQSWLEKAWIFVLTSTGEGFPNVLLQAWSAGVAVVSLHVDPNGLIKQGLLGLLSETPEGFKRDVGHLLDDNELRNRLGDASRAYVADHYEFGLVARQYLLLFEELVARSAR